MKRMILVLCLCLPSFSALLASDGTEYDIKPAAEWIQAIPAFDSTDHGTTGEDAGGFRSRLIDEQHNAQVPGNLQYFRAREYSLNNRYAVENYSRIEIDWHPGYERLAVNELSLWRDGEVIDKLGSARFDVLRLEPDRADLVYDGAKTLAIVLDDVRVGDIIRYAYTQSGENPVFNGLREFGIYTDLTSATDRHHARIISLASKPLKIRTRGPEVAIRKSSIKGIDEWVIDRLNVPEMPKEDNVPSWRSERGTLIFSDIDGWESVVEWALPMYKRNESVPPELASLATEIYQKNPADSERIGEALSWVQDKVRYFGVEIDRSTHLPASPATTLARRFGDCKDKAVLLISLLDELGIKAYPALVNSNRMLVADTFPFRLHAFDHVIVAVLHQGKIHFIDPTLSYQSGPLGRLYEPDYGKALLIRKGEESLVSMGSRLSTQRKLVKKRLSITADEQDPDASASSVAFSVTTQVRGKLAQYIRYDIDTKGLSEINDSYEKYYLNYFEGLSASAALDIVDNDEGMVTQTELYEVENFWLSEGEIERYRWLYADEILAKLFVPEDTRDRRLPYELTHPLVIEEKWTLALPQEHQVIDLDAEMENPWFKFEKKGQVQDDGKHVQVSFRYKTLTREVAAEDLEAYAHSIEELQALTSFYIEDISPEFVIFSRLAAKGQTFWRLVVVVVFSFYLFAALLALFWNLGTRSMLRGS